MGSVVSASSIPDLATITGIVQDPNSDLMYISTTAGYVLTWNEATQSVVSTLNVGRPLSSIAISADGKSLAVGEYSGTLDEYGDSSVTSVGLITLSNHAIQTLTLSQTSTSEGGVSAVAYDSAGDLLVSDDGQWVPWRFIAAGSQTFGSDSVSGSSALSSASWLESSGDHRYVLALEGNITGAPLQLYDTVAGKVIAQAQNYALGTSGFNIGNGDINDKAGLIVDVVYGEVMVLDFNLGHVAGPGTTDNIIGGHFNNSGSELFLWDATSNSILVYDTTSWQQTATLPVSSTLAQTSGYPSEPVGQMSVSQDGRYLVLMNGNGFETIDLSNPTAVTQHGDGQGDTLTGSTGPDVFIAGRGSNNFVGGGGNDTVVFDFSYSSYTVTRQADGSLVVSSSAAGEGPDHLTGIQTLQFSDATAQVTATGGLVIDASLAAAASLGASKGSDQVGLQITDSAADVTAGLASLQSLVAAGAVSGATLTDGGIPTLALTGDQLTTDSAALKAIGSAYQLSVAVPAGSVTLAGIAGHGTTFMISGDAGLYSVTGDGSGGAIVTGNGVIDHFTNVTALQFSDYTEIVARTPGSGGTITSGNVTELYGAVFGREPDAAGLSYYTAALAADPGLSLNTLAGYFLASPEYVANPAHGYAMTNAGDSQFITDCYQNLLHRAPGATDVTWYLANVINPALYGLAPGSSAYVTAETNARAAVITYFSASAEFLGDVQITAAHPADAQHWLALV